MYLVKNYLYGDLTIQFLVDENMENYKNRT